MLSASDAGRIGRLVLPKKCAEVSAQTFLALTSMFFIICISKVKVFLVCWIYFDFLRMHAFLLILELISMKLTEC